MTTSLISPEELERIKTAFNAIDVDGTGSVSEVELRKLFASLGEETSRHDVQTLLSEADVDHDGQMSLDEFIRLVTKGRARSANALLIDTLLMSEDELARIREVFDLIDLDHNGRVSGEEIAEVLFKLSGEKTPMGEVLEMVAAVDADGDGTVSFEEFADMMSRRVSDLHSLDGLPDAFAIFDRAGTGALDAAAIERVYGIMGETASRTDIELLLRVLDRDKDGAVSLADINAVMTTARGGSSFSGSNEDLSQSQSNSMETL